MDAIHEQPDEEAEPCGSEKDVPAEAPMLSPVGAGSQAFSDGDFSVHIPSGFDLRVNKKVFLEYVEDDSESIPALPRHKTVGARPSAEWSKFAQSQPLVAQCDPQIPEAPEKVDHSECSSDNGVPDAVEPAAASTRMPLFPATPDVTPFHHGNGDVAQLFPIDMNL